MISHKHRRVDNMNEQIISDKLQYPSKYAEVLGSKMHYTEAGAGNPILFLHGVPTSSYIWRNILPHVASLGRCIAPDLIGFGQSDKPDIAYTITDHINYIEKFISTLNLKNITLVMHGWGSVIGFNYAMRHQNNCRGLVFYEAFLKSPDNEMALPFQEQRTNFEDHETVTIDEMIPQSVMRQLSETEMEHYRKPFSHAGTTKPIVQYMKELPRGDGKNEVDKLITEYTAKLEKSKLPKLMMYSVPGFITTISTVIWAKTHLPNLESVDIGEELHLGQESYPDLMGETISVWLQGVEQS